MRVGFIGLGMQGGPMAEMILAAGFPLHVWARRPSVTAHFAKAGAIAEPDPAALAAHVDVLGVCVTADEDVKAVVYEGGVLEGLRTGSALLLHSTVHPQTNIELARRGRERGVDILEAPVSGSARAARAKTLVVFAGGDARVLEHVRPVLASYADPILHFGDVGSGATAKLINNLLMVAHLSVANRALEIGRAAGLSPGLLRQAVLAGTGRSFSMDSLGRMQEQAFAQHAGGILEKDLRLAEAALGHAGLQPLDDLAEASLHLLRELALGRGRVIPA